MALFRNLPTLSGQVGVKLRASLCGVRKYVSAPRLVGCCLSMQKLLIYELETNSAHSRINGWVLTIELS